MAYRFNGSSDYVQFSSAPLNGYTFGAFTWAAFLKRAAPNVGAKALISFLNASNAQQGNWRFQNDNTQVVFDTAFNSSQNAAGAASTSVWYLLVVTWSGSGVCRFHIHDGTSWSHANGSGSISSIAISPATTTGSPSSKPQLPRRRHRLLRHQKSRLERRHRRNPQPHQLPGVAQLQLRLADRFRQQPRIRRCPPRPSVTWDGRRVRHLRHNRRLGSGRLGVDKRRHTRRQLHRHPAHRRSPIERRVHRHVHEHAHELGVDVRRRRHLRSQNPSTTTPFPAPTTSS